ncbi:zinc-binding dehydrogenase, partial [Mycobacterium kansasii]
GEATVHAARELGVPDTRICTIATKLDGVTAANGATTTPDTLRNIADHVAAGRITVPIAATFPLADVRYAAELQAGRHVKGKIVIDLAEVGPEAV